MGPSVPGQIDQETEAVVTLLVVSTGYRLGHCSCGKNTFEAQHGLWDTSKLCLDSCIPGGELKQRRLGCLVCNKGHLIHFLVKIKVVSNGKVQ